VPTPTEAGGYVLRERQPDRTFRRHDERTTVFSGTTATIDRDGQSRVVATE
jgi:hypothetical protein